MSEFVIRPVPSHDLPLRRLRILLGSSWLLSSSWRVRAFVHARLVCVFAAVVAMTLSALRVTYAETSSTSDAEALEIAVSSSDLIVIGRLRSVHDSTGINPPPPPDCRVPMPAHWRRTYLDISVVETLKGPGSARDIAVFAPRVADVPRIKTALQRTGGLGLFYIERRSLGWTIAAEFAAGGVVPVPNPTATFIADRIRSIAKAQSVEALSRQADLVVIGHTTAKTECAQAMNSCYIVEVDSVIAGQPGERRLTVMIRRPRAFTYSKALFFLRSHNDGEFELLGSNAGIIPTHDLKGRQVRSDAMDLLSTIRRIRGEGDN